MVHMGVQSVPQMNHQQRSSTINFVFLSCNFPPRFKYFVRELKKRGANVLGLGDESYGIP